MTTGSSHRRRPLVHEVLFQPTHGEIIRNISQDIYSFSDPEGTVTPRRCQSTQIELRYCTVTLVPVRYIAENRKQHGSQNDGNYSRNLCRVEILVPLRDVIQVLLTPSFLCPSQFRQ